MGKFCKLLVILFFNAPLIYEYFFFFPFSSFFFNYEEYFIFVQPTCGYYWPTLHHTKNETKLIFNSTKFQRSMNFRYVHSMYVYEKYLGLYINIVCFLTGFKLAYRMENVMGSYRSKNQLLIRCRCVVVVEV